MAGCLRYALNEPQAVIHGAVERRRIVQKVASLESRWPICSKTSTRFGVFKNLEEHTRAAQPQIEQREIDVVVAAGGGL